MPIHPTDRNSDRQANSAEHHEFQFRGTFLPPKAWDLLCAGKITSTDLILAAIIDAYTKNDGKGCWASNGYLAKKLRVTSTWVSMSISKLVEIGIIKRTFEDNQRYLEVHWTGIVNIDSGSTPTCRGGSTPSCTISNTPTEYYQEKSNKHSRSHDSAATPPRVSYDGEEDTTFPLEIPGQDNHQSRKRSQSRPKLGKITPSPESLGYAQLLFDKVVDAGRLSNNTTCLTSWAKWITKAEVAYSASTVAHVFNWYIDHYRENQFIPAVDCGESFFHKFQAIVDAIERDKKANPQVTISPDAEKVAKSLTTYFAWPKGSETQLPTVVQLSLDRIAKLIEKLESKYLPPKYQVNYLSPQTSTADGHSKSLPTDIQVAHAIWRRLDLAFVREWFEQVHRHIATWDKWNGKLLPFDPSHKDFRVFAQSWTQSKCNDPKVCDRILKEISK